MQKGFVPIIVIIITSLIIGGAIYLAYRYVNRCPEGTISTEAGCKGMGAEPSLSKNTTDETANWETYSNRKFNFQFKYPSNFGPIEETEYKQEYYRILFQGEKGVGQIDVKNNKLDFIKPKPDVDVKVINLGGVPAKSFYLTDGEVGGTSRIIQTTQEPFIQLDILYSNSLFKSQFPQILATFSFLKPNESNVPWKITTYSTSPDKTKKIVMKSRYEDQDFERLIVVVDTASLAEKTVFNQTGVDVAVWNEFSVANWSPDSKYVYAVLRIPDRSNLYVFKADGGNFSSGKSYLLASDLGYEQLPIRNVEWLSNTQLQFDGTFNAITQTPTYHKFLLDVEKQTLSKPD